jgi:dipeptidase
MNARRLILVPLLFALFALAPAPPTLAGDEGMFPISEILKLDLRSKGLDLPAEEIFSPDRPSLVFAIVSVGATGSFVSPEGLFLTNHHVAFSAVQAASTPERDHLTNGFLARTRAEELQAKGMTARITESFRDVSAEVLAAIKPDMALADRTKAIEKRMKEIVAEAEKTHPGKRAEVSEMFLGKSYVLFLYTFLKDIRIAYVPPRGIGEFGGETDNWTWPRHTGDFAFLRAYAAPDGSPADFSPKNIPFKPKRFLRIDPNGLKEGDFMFLLGYPGRTYRHYPASYLAYEEDFRLPYVADWYERQIDIMEKAGAGDPAVALKLSSRIKSLANTMKNYRGKLQGMKKSGIVAAKSAEEKGLAKFIAADAKRRSAYGNVLSGLEKIYAETRGRGDSELVLEYLRSNVTLLGFGWTIHEAAIERRKPDLERESAYMDRNWDQTKQRLLLAQRNFDAASDKLILKELLGRALALKSPSRVAGLDALIGGGAPGAAIDAFIAKAYKETRLAYPKTLGELLGKTPDEMKAAADPFITLAAAIAPATFEVRERQKTRKGALDGLFARLSDVRELFLGKAFIPDANSTLRLTFGHVKGYSPADAVYHAPFTTLGGVLDKTTGEAPFNSPPKLAELHKARDFGRFAHPVLKDVPVCVLYDADTTGGNSGSPVLNARGELVGVNFDRTYGATINDYAWSEDYSRSIGVDIRYILWLTQKLAKADHLLAELGIAPAGPEPEANCYTVVVGKKASADGSVIVAHNEDDSGNIIVNLRKIKPRDYGPARRVDLGKGGVHETTGKTAGFLWLEATTQEFADSFINEHGVLLTSDSCASKETKTDVTDGGIGYMLRRLVAEQARSAREGVLLAGSLVEKYGYTGSGRTYTIADRNEAWLMAVIRGRHWYAQRVPDDEVAVIPNHYTIRAIDPADAASFLGSKDIIAYAKANGWYDEAKDGRFDFKKAFFRPAGPDLVLDRNTLRHWRGLNIITARTWEISDAYPFSVKPAANVKPESLMALLRDHYEGTPYDATNGYKTGTPNRTKYRTICTSTTIAAFIVSLKAGGPEPLATPIWIALGKPDTTIFLPLYEGVESLPPGAGLGPDTHDDEAMFKDHFQDAPFQSAKGPLLNTKVLQVEKIAEADYARLRPGLDRELRPIEEGFLAQRERAEREIASLFAKDKAAARRKLTEYVAAAFAKADGIYTGLLQKLAGKRP